MGLGFYILGCMLVATSVGIILMNKAVMATYGFTFPIPSLESLICLPLI